MPTRLVRSLVSMAATQPNTPQFLKDHEAEALVERSKLK